MKRSIKMALFILIISLNSCIFKAKNKCPASELLADTLLFKNPTSDVVIDKSWCLAWMDYSYFIKGTIKNNDSLMNNLNMLGITKFDTSLNKMSYDLSQEEKIKDWFNVERLSKDKSYLKYNWKFYRSGTTYKWIYYKDEVVCDTFYIAVVNT
jgi:hypothetical protein